MVLVAIRLVVLVEIRLVVVGGDMEAVVGGDLAMGQRWKVRGRVAEAEFRLLWWWLLMVRNHLF